MKEQREFRMDKNILYSIIKSQAGTFDKAVLELLMNSVDAGASEVRVEFDGKCFSVEDDGRGFSDRNEVEKFFETFGTPHKEGDSVYGRFRMGRGQVMAFTRNTWRSGLFRMTVDIRDKGLSYELATIPEAFKGCRIEGELYDPMTPSERIRTLDALEGMCKYLPIPAYINGKRVSVEMSEIKWTFEDEDAWYQLSAAKSALQVYNLGVLVRSYYSGQYGIGGVVISKKQLDVNFARNDVMASCPVWKRISAKIKGYVKEKEKTVVQNDAYRTLMASRLASCNFDTADEMLEALGTAKIFTDYSGKHYTLEKLHHGAKRLKGIVLPDAESFKADRVNQKQLSLILSPKMPDRLGMPLVVFLNRLIENLETLGALPGKMYWPRFYVNEIQGLTRDLDEVAGTISEQHDIVEMKSLTKTERAVLAGINAQSWYAAQATESPVREIRVCSSETVDGYTNGKSVIFVERKFLNFEGYKGGAFVHFQRTLSLLVHEYLHQDGSATGHGHPAEFYERFHDLMCFSKILPDAIPRGVTAYLSARRKLGLKMRLAETDALDKLSMEPDDEANVVELKVA